MPDSITLAEFLERYPVKIESTSTLYNPHMKEDKRYPMFHYAVKLSYAPLAEEHKPRTMMLHYSKGSAHVKKARNEWFKDKPIFPTVEEVLDCLASDASSIENARSFEDWASDFGYDTDSRKALATFETCFSQARELRALLGEEAYKLLLWETERL